MEQIRPITKHAKANILTRQTYRRRFLLQRELKEKELNELENDMNRETNLSC